MNFLTRILNAVASSAPTPDAPPAFAQPAAAPLDAPPGRDLNEVPPGAPPDWALRSYPASPKLPDPDSFKERFAKPLYFPDGHYDSRARFWAAVPGKTEKYYAALVAEASPLFTADELATLKELYRKDRLYSDRIKLLSFNQAAKRVLDAHESVAAAIEAGVDLPPLLDKEGHTKTISEQRQSLSKLRKDLAQSGLSTLRSGCEKVAAAAKNHCLELDGLARRRADEYGEPYAPPLPVRVLAWIALRGASMTTAFDLAGQCLPDFDPENPITLYVAPPAKPQKSKLEIDLEAARIRRMNLAVVTGQNDQLTKEDRAAKLAEITEQHNTIRYMSPNNDEDEAMAIKLGIQPKPIGADANPEKIARYNRIVAALKAKAAETPQPETPETK
jgi:hypothetical protein